jgi:hypothetical protein
MIMAYGNYAPFYRGGYFNPMQTPTMPPMAEGQNQFAQPYQPQPQPTPQPMANPMPTPTQANNDIIWVQGEAGAKAYLVAPNNTITLWDSESPTIYLKTADMNGVPSMRILDFKERAANMPKNAVESVNANTNEFILKEDLKAVEDEIQGILCRLSDVEAKYNSLSAKPTPKTAKKTEE